MVRAVTYALPGGRVSVGCEDPAVAAWVDEMLRPGFVEAAPRSTDPTVVARASAPGLAREDGEALGPRPCFALDREIASHPAWRFGETIELTDAKFGARYVLRDHEVEVQPDPPTMRARVAVLRVVRELATAQSLAAGGRVQLHASGVEDAGRIVLFAGPKRAGKTTLLVHVAARAGVAVAANDRVLASSPGAGEAGWSVRQVPTIVSVRSDTTRRFPELFRDVPAVPSAAHLTLAETEDARRRHGAATTPARLKLSPAQLARALGTRLSGGGALAAVARLRTDEYVVGFAARSLAGHDAEDALEGARYGASPAGTARTVFEELLGVSRSPSAERAVLRRLAAEVPCFELLLGPDVLRSADAAHDMVGTLLGRA